MDKVTEMRKQQLVEINSQRQSDDKDDERKRLEKEHGQVWDTTELGEDFTVEGFAAPYVVVCRKADGVRGSLAFQHSPRFYFGFRPA
jgi:hypothetical protein